MFVWWWFIKVNVKSRRPILMQRKLLIYFIICFLPCQLLAEQSIQSEKIAAKILKKFMLIEKHRAEYKKKKASLNKTIITVWYKVDNIKKIIVETKSEIGTSQDNFYLDNNKLILCRSITKSLLLGNSGKMLNDAKIDKQYLLYQNGELVKPRSSRQINQKYLELGIAKRNLLIETLAKIFISPDTK
jgi:uncharacterized protein YukJ